MRAFNSAFGSSYEDGINPMADIFVNNILGENNSRSAKYFYGVFYGIIEALIKDLKAVKITS